MSFDYGPTGAKIAENSDYNNDMRSISLVFVLLAFWGLGCQSKTAKLAGVWKAEPVKIQSSPNLNDVSRSAMLSLVTQNLEIEFNKEGKFKYGAGIGGGEGSYAWKGDVLELSFRTFAPQTPLQLKFEGADLVEVTDFASDAKLRFKKVR